MKYFEAKINGVDDGEMLFSWTFDEVMALEQAARHGIANNSLANGFLAALKNKMSKMTAAQGLDFIATEKLKKFEGEKHA